PTGPVVAGLVVLRRGPARAGAGSGPGRAVVAGGGSPGPVRARFPLGPGPDQLPPRPVRRGLPRGPKRPGRPAGEPTAPRDPGNVCVGAAAHRRGRAGGRRLGGGVAEGERLSASRGGGGTGTAGGGRPCRQGLQQIDLLHDKGWAIRPLVP